MKAKASTRKPEHFATVVGRALRRAAEDAQKEASDPLHYMLHECQQPATSGLRGKRIDRH